MEAIVSLSDVYKFVEIWDKRHAMKLSMMVILKASHLKVLKRTMNATTAHR